MFQTELEENIALAQLVGETYQQDNSKVYGIIKQLVIEGPGCSYVLPFDSTSDGRAAWLALRNHLKVKAIGIIMWKKLIVLLNTYTMKEIKEDSHSNVF